MSHGISDIDVAEIVMGFEGRGDVSLYTFNPPLNEGVARILRDALAAKIAVEDDLIVDIQFSHAALETVMEITVIGNFMGVYGKDSNSRV